jgi:hypothetical protein
MFAAGLKLPGVQHLMYRSIASPSAHAGQKSIRAPEARSE